MRIVLQRVSKASVSVADEIIGQIDQGLLVMLGISRHDSEADVAWMADKLVTLRVFDDEEGKLNLSLLDVGGSTLIVPNFTLMGDCQKGRRPSYGEAAEAAQAITLYENFVQAVRLRGIRVATGKFGAHMQVQLANDGPVTLVIDGPHDLT